MPFSPSKTGDGNSTTFNISEPTFAFVGIAATGNLSIRNLTVTANGFELFGPGENSTEVCQLNGKHSICYFNLINNEMKEVSLIAHEARQAPGDAYDYSNLIIKFSTEKNVGFWISLAILLFHIIVCICITMSLCITLTRVLYNRWKQGLLGTPVQVTDTQSLLTVSTSAHHIQNSDEQLCLEMPTPANQPVSNRTERDTEMPSDQEEIGSCVPLSETQPQEQHTPGPAIHGIQTSNEPNNCVKAESNDQSTTAPSGNATQADPNAQSELTQVQENQRLPTNLEPDTLSSEPHSEPPFYQPTPELKPNSRAVLIV